MAKQTIQRTRLFNSTALLLAVASACSSDDPEPTFADVDAVELSSTAVPTTGAQRSDAPTTGSPATLAGSVAESRAQAAVDLATAFLDAYFAHDADRSLQYLTDEGIASTSSDTPEEFRLKAIQTEVWRYQQRLTEPCQLEESAPTSVLVRCPYEYDAFGSDVLGVGPFTGNYLEITVRDGKVDSVNDHDMNYQAVSTAVWDPFERWARANHPEDDDMLFGDGWLTEESFRIWEQRLGEYLDEQLGT